MKNPTGWASLGSKEALAIAESHITKGKDIDAMYNRFDQHQRLFVEKIQDFKVTVIDAPAGRGKTICAVQKGLDMLRKGEVDRIIYLRFPDKRSMKMGYWAGNDEKVQGYYEPFRQALKKCGLSDLSTEALEGADKIVMTTDVFLRGTTIEGSYLMIDEAQNAETLEDLKLVLTRFDDKRGRTVIMGHSGQCDVKPVLYTKHKLTAFQVYRYHLTRKPWATTADLVINYRGAVATWADSVEDSLRVLELQQPDDIF